MAPSPASPAPLREPIASPPLWRSIQVRLALLPTPTSAAALLRSRHALSGVSLPPRLSLLAATCTGHARVPIERERMLTPAIAPIHPAAGSAGTTFTWTAPADVSSLATVTFNFFGNALSGYGALNRYSTTLNRASTATVASTAVGTLIANAATTVAFETTNLLTAATDVAAIKIVASTTTCGAAPGNGDAIAGGTCTLTGSGTSGSCSITIAFSVGGTTGNHWCYSTAATVSSSAGAFVTLSTPSTVDTTAGSSSAPTSAPTASGSASSAIASTVGGIAVATVGLALASLV